MSSYSPSQLLLRGCCRRSARSLRCQPTRPLFINLIRIPFLSSPIQRHSFSQLSKRNAQVAANTTSPSSRPTAPQPSSKPAPSSTSTVTPTEEPIQLQEDDLTHIDWTKSFHGLSVQPFAKEAADILLAPLDPGDVEIKPDGIIYLPEIKYRRILNRAFGPGGWGLAPRGETIVTEKAVTREYALLAHGR